MKKLFSCIGAATLLTTAPLHAQSLLTSSFAGAAITNLMAACPSLCFGVGPTQVGVPGRAVTFTASFQFAVLGNYSYGLNTNGVWNNVYHAGTNGDGWARFTFADAVQSVGGVMNYTPGFAGAPIIRAFDNMGNLIASYDLSVDAPISTPGGLDQGAFRGISSTSANIASFEIFGGFLVTQDLEANTEVPEPATIALLASGLLGLGVAHRRRKRHQQ